MVSNQSREGLAAFWHKQYLRHPIWRRLRHRKTNLLAPFEERERVFMGNHSFKLNFLWKVLYEDYSQSQVHRWKRCRWRAGLWAQTDFWLLFYAAEIYRTRGKTASHSIDQTFSPVRYFKIRTCLRGLGEHNKIEEVEWRLRDEKWAISEVLPILSCESEIFITCKLSHFYMNGYAPGLALIERFGTAQK